MKAPMGDAGNSHLNLDPQIFGESFDREPFGFTHNLSGLDLFQNDSLRALADKYHDHKKDYYVGAGAPEPGVKFYSVKHVDYKPADALDNMEKGSYRVLMKRPENHDKRFRALLDELFQQVVDLRGGLGDERVVRLESAIFVSSAATTTPFHFDPEIAFFCQIAGDKIYHVYSPRAVTEAEMEQFYIRGVVDIAQVDLAGRDPKLEHVFNLKAGKGLHQPQNAPHWVETRGDRSISFSFVFETTATRAKGRTRSFNHVARKLGLKPTAPGATPVLDTVKASAMRVVIPARKVAGKAARKVAGK
ncbi:MAG: hypothetical protein JWQ71_4771 [Pedosphaera sp.]|nr:hypothetical protein [Pedosphaera sp.]